MLSTRKNVTKCLFDIQLLSKKKKKKDKKSVGRKILALKTKKNPFQLTWFSDVLLAELGLRVTQTEVL